MTFSNERLAGVSQRLAAILQEKKVADSIATQTKQDTDNAAQRVAELQSAQSLLQAVATELQTAAHRQISVIVSRCLTTIFGESAYSFEIKFEKKRGRTEAVIVLLDGAHRVSPRSGAGGGVQDVISFGLRLANLVMQPTQCRKLIILDEPFKFLHSPDYRRRMHRLVIDLAAELGFQFVLSTGIPDFEIGQVIAL